MKIYHRTACALLVALVGCSKETKQLKSIETFNTFQLKLAVDEFQAELARNKRGVPQPHDIDHAAQSAYGASRGKPQEAALKKVYDLSLQLTEIGSVPKPNRQKVEAKFAEVKAAFDEIDQKK